MAAGQNPYIFSGPCATARSIDLFQGRRPRGGTIPNKNAGILFRESSAEGRNEDGTLSLSWGIPWGQPRPPKEVLKIRGGHQNSRQFEALHFYSVPWPHRRGQKSIKNVVVKLTTLLKKSVFKIQVDRRLESLRFSWVIVNASTGSIVNNRLPWHRGRLPGVQGDRSGPTFAAGGPGAPTVRGPGT